MLYYKNIKIIITSFILLIMSGCAAKQQVTEELPGNYVSVIAEGTADIKEAGMSEATDRAYIDAQRKAIEKALGKMYSARTVVDSGRFIEQTIMADVKGYIRKWEKVAGPEAQDYPGTSEKIVWVKIQAEVGLDKLKEDTFALEEMQKRLGRPDIAVIVKNNHSRQVISNKLSENKFTVRDIGTALNDPVGTANENNVELIIDGKVTAKSAGKIMKGVDMISYQSDVTLKAVNVADGEVIAQAAGHGAFPHIEEESGKAGAVRKATEIAMDKLTEQMLAAWENILNNGSGIYLKIKGITLNNESDFKSVMTRYLRGVKEVHSKDFKSGIFTYKIMYLGNAKQLAKEISSIKGRFNVNVTGYKANTVEAEVK